MRTSIASIAVAAVCAVFAMVSTARADNDDSGQIMVGAGMFDLVSHHKHPAQFDGTYRFGWGLFGGDGAFRGLKPIVGIMANTKGGVMGWGGLAAPFELGRFEIEPSAGLGAYHRGSGIDLGGTFEFHLGLGVSYAVSEHSRLGIDLTHISNANTHHINPGANSALVTWTWMFKD